MSYRRLVSLALGLVVATAHAQNVEAITGHVRLVEATYMPGTITFMLDTGTTTCPTGRYLTWSKDVENNKAVFAALLSAQATGHKVNFYYAAGDTTCKGTFLHVLND
ncbi:hypothetical protein [Cognatilysobacter terrigena]|uniref:hypothetical protein n=1 Tax=Cognatilysobacter terrigena TaxID=2488749 RepID=UPI001AAC9A58|nr:hypothetical protein [Lysobacter terrigena]